MNMYNVTRGRQLKYCINLQRVNSNALLGNDERDQPSRKICTYEDLTGFDIGDIIRKPSVDGQDDPLSNKSEKLNHQYILQLCT